MKLTNDHKDFFRRVKEVSNPAVIRELGLPIQAIAGIFLPCDVPLLLKLCEAHPEYHIMTMVSEGLYVNRYEPEGELYGLACGDNDPDLTLDERPILDLD